MEHIGDFFKKFAQLEVPQKAIIKACQEVIQEKLGVYVEYEQFGFQEGVIYIQTKSIIKSEIARQKQTIINEINNSFGKEKVRDII